MLIMSCNTTVHAYRILVSNGLAYDMYAAVYRYNDEQSFRIRTSAVKLIKSGQTALLGGVLPDSEHIHFQLYGSTSRKPLTEALSTTAPSADPYFLLDVGTGDQVFVIIPPALQAEPEDQPVVFAPSDESELPSSLELATPPEQTPSSEENTAVQDDTAASDQKTSDAAEQSDIAVEQSASLEQQHNEAAPVASDMAIPDHPISLHDQSSDEYDVILHDEPDMIRSHLLRTVHLSLASQHASRRAQTTVVDEEPARMSPHRQRPQKHLKRTRQS